MAAQDAINLFLGNYVPGMPGQPQLWELESDVYLHAAGDNARSVQLVLRGWPSASHTSCMFHADLSCKPVGCDACSKIKVTTVFGGHCGGFITCSQVEFTSQLSVSTVPLDAVEGLNQEPIGNGWR